MPNIVQIKTIQFLDIKFTNRAAFLNFIKKNVIEFALHKQELFKVMDLNAEYFHKDKQNKQISKTLIHCLIKDHVLTLRAYTQKAIETLDFWFSLFKKQYPKYCINTLINIEQFEYRPVSEPQSYTSYNWAPFRDILLKDNTFFINKEPIDTDLFQKQLFSNLLYGFIKDVLGIIDNSIIVEPKLVERSSNYQSVLALKTKVHNKEEEIIRHVFKTTFTVNVQLPRYFSLGQNVGYGLGVFTRDHIRLE